MENKINKNKGFTILELLIVVFIIALLAALIAMRVGDYLSKSRDSKRLADLEQIEKALALYYSDNGQYPNLDRARTGAVLSTYNWDDLEDELDGTNTGIKYLDKLPIDPLGLQNDYRYYYDSDCSNSAYGDNCQTYMLMTRLENSDNEELITNDNGVYNTNSTLKFYEIGPQVSQCMAKYGCSGTCDYLDPANAWLGGDTVCYGGDL